MLQKLFALSEKMSFSEFMVVSRILEYEVFGAFYRDSS